MTAATAKGEIIINKTKMEEMMVKIKIQDKAPNTDIQAINGLPRTQMRGRVVGIMVP